MIYYLNMKDGHIYFDEYIRQGEPDKKEKATHWRTAIGRQDVDGLKTSEYLKETAEANQELLSVKTSAGSGR